MMETLAELTATVDFLESNVMELRGDIRQTERPPRPPVVDSTVPRAEAMNSGPPGLSRSIAALERERAKPLFEQRPQLQKKWEREVMHLQPRGPRNAYHDEDE